MVEANMITPSDEVLNARGETFQAISLSIGKVEGCKEGELSVLGSHS